MTATAMIQRVRELAASRLVDAENSYEAVVETLASGGDVAPEDVLAVLADTDRSEDDLQADVERLEQFAQAKAHIAAEAGAALRADEIVRQRQVLRERFETIQREVKEQDAALASELAGLEAAGILAANARAAIGSGKFDLPSARARRAAAQATVKQFGGTAVNLRSAKQKATREIAVLDRALAALEEKKRPAGIQQAEPSAYPAPGSQAALNSQRHRLQREIGDLDRELAQAESEIAKANAVLSEIQE